MKQFAITFFSSPQPLLWGMPPFVGEGWSTPLRILQQYCFENHHHNRLPARPLTGF